MDVEDALLLSKNKDFGFRRSNPNEKAILPTPKPRKYVLAKPPTKSAESEETEYVCQIQNCKLIRESKEKMERHMLNHYKEGLWTCDNCSFQTYNLNHNLE